MRPTSIHQPRADRQQSRCPRSLWIASLWFAIAWAAAICPALAEPAPSSEVPFRLLHGFAIIVPVFVNERGPYDFLLDTGSSSSALDRQLGQELQLETGKGERIRTLVREKPIAAGATAAVNLGPISVGHLRLLVRDLDGLHKLDPGIRGVLGQDALGQADYLIDYKRDVLNFDTAGELLDCLGGQRIPMRRLGGTVSGSPIVRTMVFDGWARPRDLAIDTGTAAVVLFQKGGDMTAAPGFESFVQDDEGERQATELRQVKLQIGNGEWELVAHTLAYHESNIQIDGLLPASLFTRVYISGSGGFVILSPKVKHRKVVAQVTAERQQVSGSHVGR